MVASSSNKTLRELFVSIKLAGAAEAIKGLNKLEKESEDANKDLDRLDKNAEKATKQLTKMGLVAKTTGRALKGLDFGFRNTGKGISKVTGLLTNLNRSLANLPFVGSLLAGFVGTSTIFSGVQDVAAQQRSETALRANLNLQNQLSKQNFDRFNNLADTLQNQFLANSDQIRQAQANLIGSGVPLNRVGRISRLIAQLNFLNPQKEIGAITAGFRQAQTLGEITEVLKDVAPSVKLLTPAQLKSTVLLDRLERRLSRITLFTANDFPTAFRRFQLAFSNFTKTIGRPIAQNFIGIFNTLSKELNRADFSRFGRVLSRVAGSFANILIPTIRGGGGEPGFLEKLVAQLSIITLDLIEFFQKGNQSLLGRIFLKPGEAATFLNLIWSMVKSDVQKWMTATGTWFGDGFKQSIFGGGDEDSASKPIDLKDGVGAGDILKMILKAYGFNLPSFGSITPSSGQGRSFEEILRMNNNPMNNITNFNNDIKIASNTPASIITNQLNNQMALLGNNGRLA